MRSTVSLHSEPEPVKKTWLRWEGVISASRVASSAAGVAGLEEEVVVGQLLHLASGGIHQLLTAVAHVDAPQTRHPVQNALAFGVFQIDAFGLGDDATALLVQGLKNR